MAAASSWSCSTTFHTSRIASALGARAGTHAVDALEALITTLGVPRRLRDIGLAQADLQAVADAAMSDWFIGRAPRKVRDAGEVLGILRAAW